MKKIMQFIKKETVLCAALLLALISMMFVPPNAKYAGYIDYRVLALLFCLMLVVAGFQSIGTFSFLGERLLKHAKDTRRLTLILISLCFFTAMLVTNDVALITFVPFAVMILTMAEQKKLLIPVITLQTIAANLGSMLTPMGNPQNLYLYSISGMLPGEFLLQMLPLTAASGIMMLLSVLSVKKETLILADRENTFSQPSPLYLTIYGILFLVCIACVLHVLPYGLMLACVVITILACNRRLFANADYCLLLTFVCFFVFIGNIENIPAVSVWLSRLISGRELLLGILLSQIISNVPAAILLSGFTSDYTGLLYGVNIGGLGTLIASLASVISYRCYAAACNGEKGKYILVFTVYNVIFLIALSAIGMFLHGF